MAEIFPFRGVTYSSSKAGALDNVVSQPYDKITPQMRENYFERSPYNISQVILPSPDGSNRDEDYMQAARKIDNWLETGVVKRSPGACLYPYTQTYRIPGTDVVVTRKGLVALGKLFDYSTGVVRPHEQTHSGPKIDRLMLTRATGCQFGLLFMLYHDPELEVNRLIDSDTRNREPFITVKDESQVTHRMWAVDDPEKVRMVQGLMHDKKLYIADGHHRYETALTYWREQAGLGVEVMGDEGIDRAMMSFVSVQDEGLTVLPTHRVLFSLPDFSGERLLRALEEHFELHDAGQANGENLKGCLDEMAGTRHSFIFASKDLESLYRLDIRETADPGRLIAGDGSAAWKGLDVNILHKLIFELYLGIGEKDLDHQTRVTYLRDPIEALGLVCDRSSEYQAAFFLNPVDVEDVVAVADNIETMPQKSTDFFPKMLTGLVFNKINL